MTTRQRVTQAQAREIWGGQKGICPLCKRDIHPAEKFEVDHAVALGLGGSNAPDNLRAVHNTCHKNKSAVDVKGIAKADRLRKSHEAHLKAMAGGEKRVSKKEKTRLTIAERDREMRLTDRQE